MGGEAAPAGDQASGQGRVRRPHPDCLAPTLASGAARLRSKARRVETGRRQPGPQCYSSRFHSPEGTVHHRGKKPGHPVAGGRVGGAQCLSPCLIATLHNRGPRAGSVEGPPVLYMTPGTPTNPILRIRPKGAPSSLQAHRMALFSTQGGGGRLQPCLDPGSCRSLPDSER